MIKTDNPREGTWQSVPAMLSSLSPIHDPALFVDDGGRAFAYGGSSNVHPIWGTEFGPDHYFFPLSEKREMVYLDPGKHGWERFGENHKGRKLDPFIEGTWMNKHNGCSMPHPVPCGMYMVTESIPPTTHLDRLPARHTARQAL